MMTPPTNAVRILILDDSAQDVELMQDQLQQAGLRFTACPVTTEAEFLQQLDAFAPNLILADYALPNYDGLTALAATRAIHPLIPFILVSGKIGEELAIDALKQGATDYVLKHRLSRLAPAVCRAICASREHEQHEQMLTALRVSEQRYQSLFNDSPTPMWVEDFSAVKAALDQLKAQGVSDFRAYFQQHPDAVRNLAGLIRVTDVNAAVVRMHQAPNKECLIQDPQSVFCEQTYTVLAQEFALAAAGKTLFELEEQVQTLNGEPKFALVRWAVAAGCERTWERVLISVIDITAGKLAEQERTALQGQLQQAQKLESIGRLAAGIAHEINTPTQYIGDNVRFLEDAFADLSRLLAEHRQLLEAVQNHADPDPLTAQVVATAKALDEEFLRTEVPKAVAQTLEGVERVAKIVRAMKEFSHPGTTEKTAVNLNQAIESTVTVARNEWKYVADLELDLEPSLPAVHCLPGELNQVVLNVVINAAHAIADKVGDGDRGKGTITVRTRRDGDWVEVRIQDTGSGIPPHLHSRMFEPFFTTKPVGKGTGQGLAMARSVVVDKHGGTIRFETEVGRGTCFIVRLPIGPRTAKDPEPGPRNSIRSHALGLRASSE